MNNSTPMETWSFDLPFRELGERYGTPIYIFNHEQLIRNFNDYLKFTNDPRLIAYPVKANPSLAVLKLLATLGTGADCATLFEVQLAQYAGISTDHIIYNSPSPDLSLAIYILENGGMVVIDSLNFLSALVASNFKSTGSLFLRISPAIQFAYKNEAVWHKIMAHASQGSKFGIAAEAVIEIAKNLPIPIAGLHMHLGSRMDNIDSFVASITYLHHLADLIETNVHYPLQYINLGGGLGIPFTLKDKYPSINKLMNTLITHKKNKYQYMVEPGNSLLGTTMGLLTKITQTKEIRGKKWAIIDVGTDQLLNAIALNTPHQILTEDHTPLSLEGEDAIGGPLCFAGDIVLKNTQLGEAKAGDYLFIQHCGSYCYAISNHFNGFHYQGMIEILPNNEIQRCHAKEDLQLDPSISTYIPEYSENKTLIQHKKNEYKFIKNIYHISQASWLIENNLALTTQTNLYAYLFEILLANLDIVIHALQQTSGLTYSLINLQIAKFNDEEATTLSLYLQSSMVISETTSSNLIINFYSSKLIGKATYAPHDKKHRPKS